MMSLSYSSASDDRTLVVCVTGHDVGLPQCCSDAVVKQALLYNLFISINKYLFIPL